MKLRVEWTKPVILKDARGENRIYRADIDRLPSAPGIYVFGRRWGRDQFEALYVGEALTVRTRVRDQFNNLRVMVHLQNATSGRRIVLAGALITKRGQRVKKCLKIIERGLIRHFLSEGHDLVNTKGTRLRRHEISSTGRLPRRSLPRLMYVDRPKGE